MSPCVTDAFWHTGPRACRTVPMDEFRDAIAKITIEGTNVRGTGFLVAPDMVATALHVVADRKVEPPAFFPARSIWNSAVTRPPPR